MATLLGFRTAVVTGVVALAVASPLSAERLPVRIFTTADGLPSDQLQCVRSDRRGFVWFCTAEGLVRFDGQIAVTFGRDDGLSPPGVRSFLNASGDRYFVGVDDGLFAFDAGVVASPVRFTALVRDDGQPTRGVNALAESRDRTIWCGTGDGLLHLSQAGGRTPWSKWTSGCRVRSKTIGSCARCSKTSAASCGWAPAAASTRGSPRGA